jgi:hypothetical protein
MGNNRYKKHLLARHIRLVMSREEHDNNHNDNPEDYNHEHERQG